MRKDQAAKKKNKKGGSMLKRVADILEKFGVASIAIGLYRDGDAIANALGVAALAVCIAFTAMEGKR